MNMPAYNLTPECEGDSTSGATHNMTLEDFAKRLCDVTHGYDLGRVEYKFILNMLTGIHRSRSVNLTNIAKGLAEPIRLHATHKRLSRNLDNPALTESLSERLLRLGAENVGPDTPLIVHIYELNKKYARKVEYLPDPELDEGASFKVCETLASDPDSETYTPLLAKVWSEKVPGCTNDAEEIKKALHRVVQATGNKGMLYFDDQSLSGEFLKPILEDPDFNFAALVPGLNIDVQHRNETIALKSLAEEMETPYGRTVFKLVPEGMLNHSKTDMDLFIHAGAQPIKMSGSNRNLSLISLKSKSRLLGESAAPLITSKTNLRSRKALMGVVEAYLSVQDVLAAHQALRDSFDPSSFRVLTYNRLQLLMTLLQAVMYYDVSMLGYARVDDHQISAKPHDGDLHRTYLMPGSNKPGQS